MIRIYDRDLTSLGEIVTYTSIQFEESQYEAGTFEIHVHAAVEGAEELKKERIIIVDGDVQKSGIITDFSRSDNNADMIVIKGYDLKILTRQRQIMAPAGADYAVFSGSTEDAMRQVLIENFINPADPLRVSPFLRLREHNRFGPSIRLQETNKQAYEFLKEMATAYNIGWRIVPHLESATYDFETFKGADRTDEVFFEDESGTNNILSAEYTDSIENYRNVAYVFGEGEGTARKRVVVGGASGWDRHELSIDARDLQSVEDDKQLTEAEYSARLVQRGEEQLTEHLAEEFFSIKALTGVDSPFQYKRDYFLGDSVMINHYRWGLAKNEQITKVLHVWEASGYRQDLVFGQERPTIIHKIKKINNRLNVLENSKVRAEITIS